MKRTILHTSETGGPGGAETVLLSLAAGCDPAQYRSLALVPKDATGGDWLAQALRERGIEPILADAELWPPRQIARLVREHQVDLIHAHLPDQNFYACVAGALTGCPVVATYHGAIAATSWRMRMKLWTVRRRARAVVAVSQYLRRELEQQGFPAHKLFHIYNGVETALFRPAAKGRLRAELGWNGSTTLIGTVANLRDSKDYEGFVRAARLVADRFPQARFVAAGHIDAAIGARVRKTLAELAMEDRFLLLGFRPDVPAVLADLDVFVLPSSSEGLSIATIEAMAAGVPVVATRSGGPQEIVEDGRTGLLVEASNPQALAAGVGEMLSDRARAAALASAGRSAVEERFSLRAMIEQYRAVYRRVLGDGSGD